MYFRVMVLLLVCAVSGCQRGGGAGGDAFATVEKGLGKGKMAGVEITVNDPGSEQATVATVKPEPDGQYEMVLGDTKVRLERQASGGLLLLVDGAKYGEVGVGDKVHVSDEGNVIVNGDERKETVKEAEAE